MKRMLVLALLAAAAATGAAAHHDNATECDRDPACSSGRGHIAGYVCYRNEFQLDSHPGYFVGRICDEHPEGGDHYVYTRGWGNRHRLVVCENGERVYPEVEPGEQHPHLQCGPMP